MRIFYVLVLAATVLLPAFAQEKTIDKSEFTTAVSAASASVFRYREGKAYRIILSTEARYAGRPQTDFTTKRITERAVNGDVHWIDESTFGAARKRSEGITIGEQEYVRSESGKWERTEVTHSPPPPKAPLKSTVEPISSDAEYKFLGTESYKGETAKLYGKTEHFVEVNKATGQERKGVRTTKYWVAADGHLIKSDFVATSDIRGAAFMTRIVTEYEFDPAITVTAPEIVP